MRNGLLPNSSLHAISTQSTLDCFITKTKRPKVGSVPSEEELHGENSESDSDSGSSRLEDQQFHLQKRSQKV